MLWHQLELQCSEQWHLRSVLCLYKYVVQVCCVVLGSKYVCVCVECVCARVCELMFCSQTYRRHICSDCSDRLYNYQHIVQLVPHSSCWNDTREEHSRTGKDIPGSYLPRVCISVWVFS